MRSVQLGAYIVTVFFVVLGLVMLLGGGTSVVSGASNIARRLGVSPLVVGLTILAFGTSAPELVVNIVGALRNESALAFGNVLGSNLANLGLVLGLAAMVRPVHIRGSIVRRELPLLMLVTCILAVMTLDRQLLGTEPVLTRSDALILLLLFSIFIYISINDFRRTEQDALVDTVMGMDVTQPSVLPTGNTRDWLLVLMGFALLGAGGHLTVEYGVVLALDLGVSPVIVGLLVVAIGTSLPEMATSVIAALRGEADLCLGNVIGSNIFNSLMVLPVSALIRPLEVPPFITLDILVSLAFALALLPIFLYRKANMGRLLGGLFVLAYLVYMAIRTQL